MGQIFHGFNVVSEGTKGADITFSMKSLIHGCMVVAKWLIFSGILSTREARNFFLYQDRHIK